MIDEKRLETIVIHGSRRGDYCSWSLGNFTEEEAKEAFKLIWLGLWAKGHGIPMIERARRYELTPNDPEQVLAALPQEMEEKV